MGRKVGGPRMIIHADGTEEPAAEPLDDLDGSIERDRSRDVGTTRRLSARSSASAAQRSVAVNAPTNDARVTPSASATTVIGAASIA